MTSEAHERSLYEIVGGDFFVHLVDAFYDGVEHDEVLLRLYPEGSDTVGARHRLALFLAQYWGGPHDYMEERGHPRLRMRHFEFTIGELERDHWLMHMATAIESVMNEVPESDREHVTMELAQYMVNSAEHLRNR
ncbi:MAG: globin [Actinomycetes bacterium]|jgi:hemoglobin